MQPMIFSPADLSRRHFLRTGIAGSALLATGSAAAILSGCDRRPATALGYRVLRADDVPMLRKVLAAALDGALPDDADAQARAIDGALASLDRLLHDTSDGVRGVFLPLFDLMTVPVTRGPLFGLWTAWGRASVEDATGVLDRLASSRTEILRGAYNGLTTLVSLAWYLDESHRGNAQYPGPPRKIVA